MSLEGCAKIVKYLVFCFNLIFWIIGCVILGVGIYVRVTEGGYATLTESIPYATVANLLIGVGAIVCVVGFVGCVGAWKESKCLLMVFFILLLIIFIIEITAGILGYVYRDKVSQQIEEDMKNQMENYGTTGNQGLTNAWDRLQNEEHCCGVYNYTEWLEYTPTALPDSCCKVHSDDCGQDFNVTNISAFWIEGCRVALESMIEENLFLIGGVGVGIAVVQFLGMIFSLCLFCRIRNEDKYV